MTDNKLSASFEITMPRASAGNEAEALYAFAGCEIIPINSAMSLAVNADSGAQAVLAPNVVAALGRCGHFATAEAHADTICRFEPQLHTQRTAVLGTLRQLAESGLLAGAHEIETRLSTFGERPLAPTRVVIITADRPAALERLLESLLRGGSLLAHNHLLLIDDSQHPELAQQNEELVEKFNIRSSRDMQYVGPRQQKALIEALHSACPEHREAIDFLLEAERWPAGMRYGRARNFALLYTVGYRAIVLDDDILCQACASPFSEGALTLGSGRHRMALFSPDRETLLQQARPLSESPLTLHARALGQPIGAILNDFGPLDLRDSAAAPAQTLSGDAPVLLTQCGSWGDPGTAEPHWVLMLRRDAIERLAAAGDLRTVLEARSCWFGCARPTLMKAGFMSQMTGLDNSALLPPYFPAYRGEDQLFGSMLNALHPSSAVLEFDWGVPHLADPERGRGSLRRPIPRSANLGLSARLVDGLVDYRSSESAEERLQYLALQLRRLTQRSEGDIKQLYRSLLATARSEQLQSLGSLAQETAELPSQTWQGYIRRAIEEVQDALGKPVAIPTNDDSAHSATAQITAAARGFARALEAWPALRRHAPDAQSTTPA